MLSQSFARVRPLAKKELLAQLNVEVYFTVH